MRNKEVVMEKTNMSQQVRSRPVSVATDDRKKRRHDVEEQLRDCGLTGWTLTRPESRELHKHLLPGEIVRGAVYGHSLDGAVMLVATDRRVIYFDKKPVFVKMEDVSYEVISGITISWVLYAGIVTLHTRFGDLILRTRNKLAAQRFKDYIDERMSDTSVNNSNFIQKAPAGSPFVRSHS